MQTPSVASDTSSLTDAQDRELASDTARPRRGAAPTDVPDGAPHVLRHTAGTTMTRSGTDIVVVAEILGHSMETARRYALPSPEDRHTAINRLTTDQ